MKYLIAVTMLALASFSVASPWSFEEVVDQFEGTTKAYAYSDEVTSLDDLLYPYDGLKVRMVMTCSTESPFVHTFFRFSINPTFVGGKPDYTRGVLDSNYGLKVKFDDGKLLTLRAGKNAVSKDAVVYSSIVWPVRAKHSLKVRFNIHSQDALYEFNLKNSNKSINEMLASCNSKRNQK